jgi:predicted ATPase
MGQWRYSHATEKLTATMQIAQRVYTLAQEQNDSALLVGAYNALAGTLYFMGDFESAHQYAMRGAQIWRSESVQSHKSAAKLLPVSTDAVDGVQEVGASAVSVLCYEAQGKWHLGEIAGSKTTVAEAISLAKEMNDMHGLVVALWHAGLFAYYEGNPAEVERLASKSIELSTRHHFAHWLPQGEVLRGWARSTSGDITEGIPRILEGIQDFRATGALRGLPFFLALKAEALRLADCIFEALEAVREAEELVERSEERLWRADLHRLRGMLLTATAADETKIEASFSEAIRAAKEQKSISLTRRAEASYAEYRRQKEIASRGCGFRLPL